MRSQRTCIEKSRYTRQGEKKKKRLSIFGAAFSPCESRPGRPARDALFPPQVCVGPPTSADGTFFPDGHPISCSFYKPLLPSWCLRCVLVPFLTDVGCFHLCLKTYFLAHSSYSRVFFPAPHRIAKMALSDSAATALSKFTDELVGIERKCDEDAGALRVEYRSKMEPLLQERREVLKSVNNFWSGVLSSPSTPIAEVLNGTIDPKIVRAITDFQIVTRVSGKKLYRKIIVTFRPNMFVEEGEVSREVDTDMHTTALTPLKWKSGTERARTDSFFTFFTDEFAAGVEAMTDIVEGLDIIYQDPFLAVEED